MALPLHADVEKLEGIQREAGKKKKKKVIKGDGGPDFGGKRNQWSYK